MSNSTTSTDGSFENEYIKFEYPPNLIVNSSSPNNNPKNTFAIRIYNNTSSTQPIIEISTDYIPNFFTKNNNSNANFTTIAGRKAITAPIKHRNSDNTETMEGTIKYIEFQDNVVLEISLYNNTNTYVLNKILNTLVIK